MGAIAMNPTLQLLQVAAKSKCRELLSISRQRQYRS